MSINAVNSAGLYGVYKVSKSSAISEQTSTNQVKESDSVKFSDEAKRQSEISLFLKDKAFSSYQYEVLQKYDPKQADKFINNLMSSYEEPVPEGAIELLSYKNKDQYLTQMGIKTADDYRKSLSDKNFIKRMHNIDIGLSKTEDVLKIVHKDARQYGNALVDGFQGTLWKKVNSSWDMNDWLFTFDEKNLYYQDIKLDKENADIMILPKGSNEWVRAAKFCEDNPDYAISTQRVRDGNMIFEFGDDDLLIKYAEKVIADLSDSEKEILKNNRTFAHPAYKKLGIEGTEEFTKDYTEFEGFHTDFLPGMMLSGIWGRDLSVAMADILEKSNVPRGKQEEYEEDGKKHFRLVAADVENETSRNDKLSGLMAEIGIDDPELIDNLTVRDLEIYLSNAHGSADKSNVWGEIFLLDSNGDFQKDANGKFIRNTDSDISYNYDAYYSKAGFRSNPPSSGNLVKTGDTLHDKLTALSIETLGKKVTDLSSASINRYLREIKDGVFEKRGFGYGYELKKTL